MKIQYKISHIGSIIFASIVLRLGSAIISNMGIMQDEYGSTLIPDILTPINSSIIFGIPLLVIILNISMLLIHKKTKQISIIIIMLSIGMTLMSAITVIETIDYMNQHDLKRISLVEMELSALMDFFEEGKSGIVYIKRDDCVECEQMDGLIYDMFTHDQVYINIYSTTTDRDHNAEVMYEFLDTINVYSVPTLLVCENGVIVSQYGWEEQEDIRKFLSKEN